MRVLIDTNILFSALLFPKSVPARAVLKVSDEYEAVLCDLNISELRDIVSRKAPYMLPNVDIFLAEFQHEIIPAVYSMWKTMRDVKDQPIFNAAVLYEVDVILTGDKDFLSLDIEHPRCITASEFLNEY